MISKFGRFIPIIFLITAIFALLNTVTSFSQLQQVELDQQNLSRTYVIIHTFNSVIRDITKAEADQRNFLLLSDQSYASLYKDDIRLLAADTTSLESLTRNNAIWKPTVAMLTEKATKRKALLDQGITIFQTSGLSDAQTFIAAHNGQKLLSDLTAIGHAITTEQNSSLETQRTTLDTRVFRLYTIIILSGILNILLLTFAYVAIMRELRQRTILERSKDEFISLTSHELRTPITTISIFSEMLGQKLGEKADKQTRHILTKMHDQILEMKNLINDLLDISRLQLGKFTLQKETFDLVEVARETHEDMQASTKKHKISLKAPKHVPVCADKQRIWQVIINLLSNAIKYSPKGGSIHMVLEKRATNVLIGIKDPGIGISKKDQLQIFNRYFRGVGDNQSEFTGLGLGLFLAQQIVHMHGGRIWVKSARNKGSTFYFTLPLEREMKQK